MLLADMIETARQSFLDDLRLDISDSQEYLEIVLDELLLSDSDKLNIIKLLDAIDHFLNK